jgi:hypothetical protein
LPRPVRDDERPAQLSASDYALLPPEPDWARLRRAAPKGEAAPDPVQRRARREAPDLPYAPAPKNPWGA